jgi:hypothetical protein
MSRYGNGNTTNYYRNSRPVLSYRKHVDWKDRWDAVVSEGFDNERSHGIVRLPDSGICHNCGEKIINESKPHTKYPRGEDG